MYMKQASIMHGADVYYVFHELDRAYNCRISHVINYGDCQLEAVRIIGIFGVGSIAAQCKCLYNLALNLGIVVSMKFI